MADPLTRLVARLKATTAVTALVGSKISPVFSAQETDWPYIVYQLTSDTPLNCSDGTTGTKSARIQVDLVAKGTPGGYAQVRALAAAVEAVVNGWKDDTGAIWHLDEGTRDNPGALLHGQDVIEFHRATQDYLVWYSA
jgi:hypothetical protein